MKSRRGFTLTEIVVVLVMLSTLLTVFFNVFITNWAAYQDQIVRSDLLQQSNDIFEKITNDSRKASSFGGFVVSNAPNEKTLTIKDPDNNVIAIYKISSLAGRTTLDVFRPGMTAPQLLSNQVLFANSIFDANGPKLTIDLAMETGTFMHKVQMLTSTEIFSRN